MNINTKGLKNNKCCKAREKGTLLCISIFFPNLNVQDKKIKLELKKGNNECPFKRYL